MIPLDRVQANALKTTPQKALGVSPAMSPSNGTPSSALVDLAQEYVVRFERNWQKAHIDLQKRLRALQPEAKRLVEIQVAVQELNLGAQVLIQTAEAVNSTLRRVQQLGAS